MAKINPRDHANSYKDQAAFRSFDTVPPPGTYRVVNVRLEPQLVGEKKTRKLRIKAHVLAHIESTDGAGAAVVGKECAFDLWSDTSKQFNAALFAHLGIACGQTEEWDPEVPAELVKAITGVPYQLRLDNEPYTDGKGEQRMNVKPMEFVDVGAKERKKYVDDPQWTKLVGKPQSRLVELKDWSQSSNNSRKGADSRKEREPVQENPFREGPNRDDNIPPF